MKHKKIMNRSQLKVKQKNYTGLSLQLKLSHEKILEELLLWGDVIWEQN